ncbi:MAG: hypothetical protein AB1772_07210 [Candidatus Zixiibacteriota bacterium]
MRCREARRRIDVLGQNESAGTADFDLQVHLHDCGECAEYARTGQMLQTAFETARLDDTGSTISLDQQRELVDQRLRAGHRVVHRTMPAAAFASGWSFLLRPGMRWTMGAVAVAVLALVFVPFSHYHTVGYDLSVDGVSRELALNQDQMCDILSKLGLVEAGVEVVECDTTCCVAIFDLKSEYEAHLVAGAIARLSETDLTTNIVPIRTRKSRTLIEQANDLIRRGV